MSRAMAYPPNPAKYEASPSSELKSKVMAFNQWAHNWASEPLSGTVTRFKRIDGGMHTGCSMQVYCLRCERLFCNSCDTTWSDRCSEVTDMMVNNRQRAGGA
jgi:hypothetical protein